MIVTPGVVTLLQEERDAERRLAMEQERARREEEEREKEQEAERMRRAAKKPVAEDIPKVIVVVKGDRGGAATPSRRSLKAESPRIKTSESKKSRAAPPPEEEDELIPEEIEKPKAEREKTPIVLVKKEEPEPEKKEVEKKEPEKKEPPKEADDKKKKQKSKIVRKTKVERQISNLEHVTNKYEPGRVLGDGNFAIVKSCKQKNSPHEYAMKIVDKAKLKGKEQMIENEIDIMKKCNHPNIVKLFEEYETKSEIYLIMELVKVRLYSKVLNLLVMWTNEVSEGIIYMNCNSLWCSDKCQKCSCDLQTKISLGKNLFLAHCFNLK